MFEFEKAINAIFGEIFPVDQVCDYPADYYLNVGWKDSDDNLIKVEKEDDR